AIAFKLDNRTHAANKRYLCIGADGAQGQFAASNQMTHPACQIRVSLLIKMMDIQPLILADLSHYNVHSRSGPSQDTRALTTMITKNPTLRKRYSLYRW